MLVELTTGHFGIWVLPQVSVQDGVADLVTDLVCRRAEHQNREMVFSPSAGLFLVNRKSVLCHERGGASVIAASISSLSTCACVILLKLDHRHLLAEWTVNVPVCDTWDSGPQKHTWECPRPRGVIERKGVCCSDLWKNRRNSSLESQTQPLRTLSNFIFAVFALSSNPLLSLSGVECNNSFCCCWCFSWSNQFDALNGRHLSFTLRFIWHVVFMTLVSHFRRGCTTCLHCSVYWLLIEPMWTLRGLQHFYRGGREGGWGGVYDVSVEGRAGYI